MRHVRPVSVRSQREVGLDSTSADVLRSCLRGREPLAGGLTFSPLKSKERRLRKQRTHKPPSDQKLLFLNHPENPPKPTLGLMEIPWRDLDEARRAAMGAMERRRGSRDFDLLLHHGYLELVRPGHHEDHDPGLAVEPCLCSPQLPQVLSQRATGDRGVGLWIVPVLHPIARERRSQSRALWPVQPRGVQALTRERARCDIP